MANVRYPRCGIVFMLTLFAGCASRGAEPAARPAAGSAKFFESPQQAVSRSEELLRKQDWSTLASYYDLSGSGVDRSELTSGRFFMRSDRPSGAHPGVDWRYKQPFAPGFKFDHVEPTDRPDVQQVIVSISIDQGGGMVQKGLKSFLLRKSARGYQLLPNPPPQPQQQPPSTATETAER
jgi:hypothetical protein